MKPLQQRRHCYNSKPYSRERGRLNSFDFFFLLLSQYFSTFYNGNILYVVLIRVVIIPANVRIIEFMHLSLVFIVATEFQLIDSLGIPFIKEDISELEN